MNQAELIEQIASNAGVSKADVKKVLDAQTVAVHTCMANGDEVTLHGIGKIKVNHRDARQGRNPSTGEAMQIAAKYVPAFSAAKALKDAAARN